MTEMKDEIATIDAKKRKKLILEPINGFGNRLRAMASGAVLANALGRDFYVDWQKDDGKFYVPSLDQVFAHTPGFEISSELTDPGNEYAGGHQGEQRLLSEIVKNSADTIRIKAGGLFIASGVSEKEYNRAKSDFYNKLQFHPDIVQTVDNFQKRYFSNQKVLGVHIRRTDRSKYTGPTRAFIEKIKQLSGKYQVIFLCTDDKHEEVNIQRHVKGIKVVSYPKYTMGRTNQDEFRDAVIDWLLLSRTDRILFSKGSSFGYEACFPKRLRGSLEIGVNSVSGVSNSSKSKFPALQF